MAIFSVNNKIVFVDSTRGSYIRTSSSHPHITSSFVDPAKIVGILEPTAGGTLQYRIPSRSFGITEDITSLFITSSDGSPKMGVGTSAPLGVFDIRSTDSNTPANLTLRTNEDGVVTAGEETGRIRFLIESSSYNIEDITTAISGASAEIFSRVNEVTDQGVKGSIVFALSRTTTSASIDAFEVGYEAGSSDLSSGDIHAVLSGSMEVNAEVPRLILRKSDNSAQPLVKIGSVDNNNFDHASIILNDVAESSNTEYFVIRKDSPSYLLPGTSNFGIGTTSPDEKLEVEGNTKSQRIIITSSDQGYGGIGIPDFTTAIKFSESTVQDQIFFDVYGNGSLFKLDGNLVQNRVTVGNGGDVDFRVRGENDINTIYVEGSSDKVGIGTDTPGEKLTVIGNISGSGKLFASLSFDNSGDTGNIQNVVYNTSSGQFFITGSGISGAVVEQITVGSGLDVTPNNGGTTPHITLDLSEFTTMTNDIVGGSDHFIVLDNGAERKKLANTIDVNQFDITGSANEIFFRDGAGMTTNPKFKFEDSPATVPNSKIFYVGTEGASGDKIGFRFGDVVQEGNAIFSTGIFRSLSFEEKVLTANTTYSFARFERIRKFFSLYPIQTGGVNALCRLHVSDPGLTSNGNTSALQPVVKILNSNSKGRTGMFIQTAAAVVESGQNFRVLEFHSQATDTQINGLVNHGGIYWDPNNTFGFLNPPSSQLIFTGAILQGSDKKLKKNITDTTKGINDILNLKVRDFNLKTDKEGTPKSVGLIAQEVQETFPELVGMNKQEDHLTVDYQALIPVLTKAIQDLQQQVDELKNQLNSK